MGGVADDGTVVMDAEVRVMVLAVGDPGQRVHEGHGGVVILEAERPHQRLAGLGQLPAGNLRQQFGQAGLAQLVVAAFARHAMGLRQRNQVGHGFLHLVLTEQCAGRCIKRMSG
ncbi:hypothetical protein D3C73_980070 [compost metagenome]